MLKQTTVGHPNNIIPIGYSSDRVSDSELELIADISQDIGNILEPEVFDLAVQDMKNVGDLFDMLTSEVERISKELKYNYHLEYSDYFVRLSLNDESILLAQDKLFDTYPKLKELYERILSFYPEGHSRDLIKSTLYSDLLEDLIYESLIIKESLVNTYEIFLQLPTIIPKNILVGIKEEKIQKVNISKFFSHKEHDNNVQFLTEFVNNLTSLGVILINFGQQDFTQFFSNDKLAFIEFIENMCRHGIKHLHLEALSLSGFYRNDSVGFTELIRMVGGYGVTYLNIGNNNLAVIFDNNPVALIEFVKVAGLSGIKCIDLWATNISKIFGSNYQLFIELISAAGINGIKSLELGGNDLSTIFNNNPKAFIELVRIAGFNGIKYLDIGVTKFDVIFGGDFDSILAFIDTIGYSGLKKIKLRNNWNEMMDNFDSEQRFLVFSKIDELGRKQIKLFVR